MTTETVEFEVPLPPASLRSNARAHWRKRKADADAYSEGVAWSMMSVRRDGCPWAAARVTYTWRYCGNKPDVSNVAGSTKHLQDIICMAPKNGAGKDRYYLGIVENDREIEPVYKLERVAHRDQQGVTIRIERREEHQG